MITKKLIKPISKYGIANIDLDNYYTKPQVDSKLETINNEINTKQDALTAGNNITIQNNTISANIPQVDLSNYYNKQEIDNTINSVKGNVADNTNDINGLKTKDTQLENTINTNKQNITTNTNDIANIKTQQTTQDQQISSNRDLSNQIIEGLKTLRVFNYIGSFNPTTIYKRNDAIDYNNRLFLSKVDNNVGNTPPSDNQSNTYWLLVDGVQASVNLSDYYTKLEVNNKLQDYLAITTFNQTIQQIQTKQGEQDTLISQKANTSDLANYYNKSEVDSKVDTINNELNDKANISDLNGYAKLNESNNSEFFIGNKNGQHIWITKPFQYGRDTFSSIKIRNGGRNFLTLETNFTDNASNLSSPNGEFRVYDLATPIRADEAANKQYVDSSITTLTNEITTIKQEQTTQNQQIATKQDILSAGNNISILNNVISANVDLSNYYTRSEVDSLIKTITFGSQATFHYVDGLNVNTQRYRWYRVDTSSTPLNANNCLNIEYKTTDPKEITFSYKWESDTSILLTFCKINGQQDYRAIGTLIAKYI